MNKAKLHSEIHNGIMYLLSKNITKEKLQSTIERMIDEYHNSEVKKLNLAVVNSRFNWNHFFIGYGVGLLLAFIIWLIAF